jgi:hypothetical protein
MDDAIRSLRNLFLGSLAIMLLWFVTWPTAIEKLNTYLQLRHVAAWLHLTEAMGEFAVDPFYTDDDQEISSVEREYCDPRSRGDCYPIKVAIEVKATWPNIATERVNLKAEGFYVRPEFADVLDYVKLYRVDSPAADLPLSSYYVAFVNLGGEVGRRVIPIGSEEALKENAIGLRFIDVTTRELNQPMFWPLVQPSLTKHGYTSDLPNEISRGTPALGALQLEADPRLASGGVQIFGIKVSIGVFFASVGMFLAAIAFAALGPVTTLRRLAQEISPQTWILALTKEHSPASLVLEAVIVIASLAWALAPLFILTLQLRAEVDLTGVSDWGVPLGAIGLIFSSLVFLWTCWELWRVRNRATTEEVQQLG